MMATKINNTAVLYDLVDNSLKFLPFWNLVSITIDHILYTYNMIFYTTLDSKLLFMFTTFI